MSNGATMAGRLACERPEWIAAFAQVAGTAAVEVAARCRASVPVPILQIHGTADRATPYREGAGEGSGPPPDDSPSGGPGHRRG